MEVPEGNDGHPSIESKTVTLDYLLPGCSLDLVEQHLVDEAHHHDECGCLLPFSWIVSNV